MINISQITKAYDQTVVLDIPELQIAKGVSFGLVGNNGAGKTTLFSLILDLIEATTGTVQVKEADVSESEEWKAFIGSFVDENFLIDFLTPEEYFEFVGKLHGMNSADVKGFLADFEEFFNGEVLDQKKYIRALSKGNKKKVGIVAALMGHPEVLLLDEPFISLDPSSQIRLKRILKDLQDNRELTVLISSHNLNHVAEVCDRIVILEKGRLIQDIQASEDTLKELHAYFTV